jgi:hypothetical protein
MLYKKSMIVAAIRRLRSSRRLVEDMRKRLEQADTKKPWGCEDRPWGWRKDVQ